MSEAAKSTVLIDNDKVRVTEWRFAPGAATGWHRHELDYVVVPLLDGRLKIVSAGDTVTYVDKAKGVPSFDEAGDEHDVVNANDFEFVFVETELK